MVVEFGAGGLLKMTGQQWCGSSSKNVVASLGLRELFDQVAATATARLATVSLAGLTATFRLLAASLTGLTPSFRLLSVSLAGSTPTFRLLRFFNAEVFFRLVPEPARCKTFFGGTRHVPLVRSCLLNLSTLLCLSAMFEQV